MRRYYILAKYRRKEHQRAFLVVVVAGAAAQIAAFDLLEKYHIKTDMLANMLPGVCRRKVQHIDQGMQGWVIVKRRIFGHGIEGDHIFFHVFLFDPKLPIPARGRESFVSDQ